MAIDTARYAGIIAVLEVPWNWPAPHHVRGHLTPWSARPQRLPPHGGGSSSGAEEGGRYGGRVRRGVQVSAIWVGLHPRVVAALGTAASTAQSRSVWVRSGRDSRRR
ncbi:MAG: hypothetical protein M3Y19_09585 [Actinomycetota bacterium]|nr:hypothetical protein [Actinomycetota bacterium]